MLLVTAELSGELHAAKMVKELLQKRPDLTIDACGGDNLAKAGANCFLNFNKINFMGLSLSVLPQLIYYLIRLTIYLKQHKPKLVVLVDYPGFNLLFAKIAKKFDCKVLYYIAPKIWASRPNRINRIKKYVDHMAVIFPFELDIFKNVLPTSYVGNPLYPMPRSHNSKDFVISLFPGSRNNEIKYMLPIMQDVSQLLAKKIPHAKIVFAQAATVQYNVQGNVNANSLEVLQKSDIVVVTAGTAALEAALLEKPMVVCYKTSRLNFWFAKKIIISKYISLPNILLNKPVVPELLQEQASPENIVKHVMDIYNGENKQCELVKIAEQFKSTNKISIADLVLQLLQ